MKIYEYKCGQSLKTPPAVLALGFFDGVTSAHRELISAAGQLASKKGLPLGVFTFPAEDPVKKGSPRIYSTEEKLFLLEGLSVDFVILADFASISSLSPEEFVSQVLIGDAFAEACASGFNFRFGHKAMGDARELRRLMELFGKEALIKEELCEEGVAVSSSRIRECLKSSDIDHANKLLGAPFMLSGVVRSGINAGRSLGFPTVNTDIPEGRATPIGVFRSAVPVDGEIYHAVTNIGICPTLGERELHAETHILNFSGDLYGRELRIYILGYLRDEIKFETKEALSKQVEEDKIKAIKENGELSWQKLGLK